MKLAIFVGVVASITAASARMLHGHEIPDYISKFLVIGDYGAESRSAANRVAEQMNLWAEREGGVDFILSVGDNFYPDGPTSITDDLFNERWADVYTGEYIKDTLWMMSVGNHDYYPYEGYEWNEVLRTSMEGEDRWYLPWLWHNTTFESPVGMVHLVVADSQAARKNMNNRTAMYQWWEDTIQWSADEGMWVLPVAHHPCHTAGGHYPGSSTVCNSLLPALKDHHVEFFLHGHDHNMQHLQFVDEPDWPEMLVIGGGGASLYSLDPDAEEGLADQGVSIEYFSRTYGFAGCIIDEDGISFHMYDDEGELLRTIRREKANKK